MGSPTFWLHGVWGENHPRRSGGGFSPPGGGAQRRRPSPCSNASRTYILPVHFPRLQGASAKITRAGQAGDFRLRRRSAATTPVPLLELCNKKSPSFFLREKERGFSVYIAVLHQIWEMPHTPKPPGPQWVVTTPPVCTQRISLKPIERAISSASLHSSSERPTE